MGQWIGIKLDWLQRGTPKLMELSMRRLFLLTIQVVPALATHFEWDLH